MKKILIGKDCSPARMVSHKEINTTKVIISYGGGMGGSTQTLYCTDVLERDTDAPVSYTKLTLLSGQTMEINPRFIVSKTPVRVVKVVADVTGHSYYNPDGAKKCTRTMITELLYGQEYEIVDSNNNSRNDQIIFNDITFN